MWVFFFFFFFFNTNFVFVATLMLFGPTLFRQNYPEDPLGETWVGSFWLF